MDVFLSYLMPTLFVGGLCFGTNVLGHGYLPDSPHVWIDVLANMSEYMASKLITQFTVDRILSGSEFAQQGADLVMEPLIHGLLNGVIKPFQIDENAALNAAFFNLSVKGKAPITTHYTFANGFTDGVQYNALGRYLAMPITGM